MSRFLSMPPKLRLNGTPRKPARFHCLRSPHVSEPRAILCVGRYSTGVIFAHAASDLDTAFETVATLLKIDALAALLRMKI